MSKVRKLLGKYWENYVKFYEPMVKYGIPTMM